jgi:Glyoxalase-like domain
LRRSRGEVAERKVLALGATRVPDADEDDAFRVYRDPVGHPFCLVWSVLQPDPISTAGAGSGV